MTLPLHKRPPTTPSRTPSTKASSRSAAAAEGRCPGSNVARYAGIVFWAIVALTALVVLARPEVARAAESQVRAVNYATGTAGHQLKWLSTGRSGARAIKQVGATEDVADPSPSRSAGPALSAPVDAFGDPFEDSKKKADASPAVKLSQGAPEKSPAKAPAATPIPKPSSEEREVLLPKSETVEPAGKPSEETTTAPFKKPQCPKPQQMPEDFRGVLGRVPPPRTKTGDEFPVSCEIGIERPYDDRLSWARTTFTWKASALCHKPAYFEDEAVERYGHTVGPWAQSIVSGGHFFLTVPILPYLMALYPPNECIYTLGYYRPGSCAPFTFDPLPLSIRAAIAEGGVWTGMVFLIP